MVCKGIFAFFFFHLVFFSANAKKHQPSIRVHSIITDDPSLFLKLQHPSAVSILKDIESLTPANIEIKFTDRKTKFIPDNSEKTNFIKDSKPKVSLTSKETEEDCSDLIEPSNEPVEGLFNKDFQNEVVVSEPPYGWVYPPGTKTVQRLKTIRLYLPDEASNSQRTISKERTKNFLRNILQDRDNFYKTASNSNYFDSVNTPVFKSSTKQIEDPQGKNGLQFKTNSFNFLSFLSNPFSRAAKAVEDWWNGAESNTTTINQSPQPYAPYNNIQPGQIPQADNHPMMPEPTTAPVNTFPPPPQQQQPLQPPQQAQPPFPTSPMPNTSPVSVPNPYPSQMPVGSNA